jgi:hypothetical protein
VIVRDMWLIGFDARADRDDSLNAFLNPELTRSLKAPTNNSQHPGNVQGSRSAPSWPICSRRSKLGSNNQKGAKIET